MKNKCCFLYNLLLPVIYYQNEHSEIPFVAEDVFKEIDGDISRTYEAFNYSLEMDEFQEKCEYEKYQPYN